MIIFMTGTIFVTNRIKADLERLAKERGIKIEGLACVLLRLALSDSHLVETALKLIESCDLNHGAAELEKRGW